MSLKGSKTEENLKAAFAGESQANRRYLYFAQKADVANNFQHLLFTRVVPNLSRIGLLTEKVRPLYDELGVLEYENWPTDGDIDWVSLEQPLDFSETA